MAARKTTSSKTAQEQTAKTETHEQTRRRQFPAKAGEPEAEVAERSAGSSDGMRYVRDFTVLAARWTGEDYQHEANRSALVGEAIQRGLHPRGDVSFDGQEEHPDGKSLVLTYSVETVPASVDTSPEDTTTPRDVIEADGKDTSSSKSEG